MESWLTVHLSPAVDFRFHELEREGKRIVLLEIPACKHTPVQWKEIKYIRVGSYKKKLSDFPEKERALWLLLSNKDIPFEKQIALPEVSHEAALQLLNFTAYYDLTEQALPSTTSGIIERLISEDMVVARLAGNYDITNFGAILIAKRLSDFPNLRRKAVRVITYTGSDRTTGGREYVSDEGYAIGFERLVAYINNQLPINEHIEQAFRVETPTYPEIAVRELAANAVIHQDLTVSGTSPMVEIFTNRMEITNPGLPLITPLRFVDEPPRSRNEKMAAFMRRVKICEEGGTGIDKVIRVVESFQLPAPDIVETSAATRITLFAKRDFREMNSQERIRACYWHACLLCVSGSQMTNESLRRRLGLSDSQHNQVGRIIADARKANLIKAYDPANKSPRYARYIPFWA